MQQHHHPHLRKRLEPYPARTPWKRILDKVIFAIGIIGPVMSIPQIVLIYSSKNAAGVEPITWLAWAAMNIPWILYGLAHKEAPIAMTHTLWFFCNGLVFVGALLY